MSVGGLILPWWIAAYYVSADLSGSPAYTRNEVRIDYAMPAGHKPGGSSSPGFTDVPADGWSASYIGRIKVRDTGTAQFCARSNGKVRLYGRVDGIGSWDTLIDEWSHAATRDLTADVDLDAADDFYEVKLEYAAATGDKVLNFLWDAPWLSGQQVVECAVRLGDHLVCAGDNKRAWYADLVKSHTTYGGTVGGATYTNGVDADGWPNEDDAVFLIQESTSLGLTVDPLIRGILKFRYTGTGTPGVVGNARNMSSSYHAGTNVTSGTFEIYDASANATFFVVVGSGTGVRFLEIMKPDAPDSVTQYEYGTLFDSNFAEAFGNYTTIRIQRVGTAEVTWADRTLPAYPYQHFGRGTDTPVDSDVYGFGVTYTLNGMSSEQLVQVANELGKDITVPLGAMNDDTYIENFAKLVVFGSDGVNPYTTVTADPVYPPLNPNLRIIVEIGNEWWNFASGYWDYRFAQYRADAEYTLATPVGVLLSSNSDTRRLQWIALQTARIKSLMVAAVGGYADRLLTYLEFQYANSGGTASGTLDYLDKQIRTADLSSIGITATKTKDVVDFAAGAGYWSTANPDGVEAALVTDPYGSDPVAGGGFEANVTAVDPDGNIYSTESGVVDDGSITLAPPDSRTQVMWVAPGGSITFPFRTPASQSADNVFSFAFRAVNREAAPDKVKLTVTFNKGLAGEADVTAQSFNQSDGFITPPAIEDGKADWNALEVFWTASYYYHTNVVALDPDTDYTFTIEADGTSSGAPSAGEAVALIAEASVCSSDEMATGMGLSTGQANGQPPDTGLEVTLRVEAAYARYFGLIPFQYESGRSFGGDTGGSPHQLWVLYSDDRTRIAQRDFLTRRDRAGFSDGILGTYLQESGPYETYAVQSYAGTWASQPIPAANIEYLSTLPAFPNYRYTAPVALPVSTAGDLSTDGYRAWVFCVPTSGDYTITGANLSSGQLQLDGDDITSGSTAFVEAGQHCLRLVGASGAAPSATATATIEIPSAPATAPAIAGLSLGKVLSWSSDANATVGYVVRWGLASREYTERVVVTGSESLSLDGLILEDTVYCFAVASVNASGEGLPGTEQKVYLIVPGQPSKLALWDTTYPRDVDEVLPQVLLTNSGVTVSDLVSTFPEFYDDAHITTYGNISGLVGSHSAGGADTDHADAHASNHIIGQFTVTPGADPLVIDRLKFFAFTNPIAEPVATAGIWLDDVHVYTSAILGGGAGHGAIDANLSAFGPFTDPVVSDITIAPTLTTLTRGLGEDTVGDGTLELTGTVQSSTAFNSQSVAASRLAGAFS